MNRQGRKTIQQLFLLCVLGIIGSTTSWSADETETRYVAKQASVALLATPSPEAVILARLVPDEPVTLLGESTGYLNVRTVSGMEGWLNETAVTAEVPAGERLEDARTRIAELEGSIENLQRQLRNAQAQARQASTALDNRQQDAQAEVERLQAALQQAQAEASELRDRNNVLEADIADYELAEQSRQLLARARPVDQDDSYLSELDLPVITAIAAVFLLAGFVVGYLVKARRIRRRFHGMEI